MNRNPSTGDLSANPPIKIYDKPAACSTTGDGARALTACAWGQLRPLVYDIDLDGQNDLISLGFSESPRKVVLQVWSWNGMAFVPHEPNPAVLPDLDSTVGSISGNPYFNSVCQGSSSRSPNRTFGLRVMNARGRTMPQDLLVWSSHPTYGNAFAVFAYATSQSPRLQVLMQHSTDDSRFDVRYRGDPGHNFREADIDYDGFEEVVGQQVVRYTGNGPYPDDRKLLWGMVMKVPDDVDPPSDNHPDQITIADFLRSYVDEAGNRIPSPGLEVLVAAQTEGIADSRPDPSAAWLYRGLGPHDAGLTAGSRRWPRRIVNLARNVAQRPPPFDGQLYWFPSETTWRQPVTGGANPSNWDQLGSDLVGGFATGNPNTQNVLFGNLLHDPTGPAGADQKPGPEALMFLKSQLASASSHCNAQAARTHVVLDGSDALAFVAWGENTPSVLTGPAGSAELLDVVGTRDRIECFGIVGWGCGIPQVAHVFRFVKDTGQSLQRSFRAESLWSLPVYPNQGRRTAVFPADMIGDSREELVYMDEAFAFAANADIAIAYDTAEIERTEPSPFRFLDYRRRTSNGTGYAQYVDYDAMAGLRFHTRRLHAGKTGSVYGVPQDPVLAGGTGWTGCGILAEGGQPPYQIELIAGVLPTGLTATKLHGAAAYDEVLLIHGTPVESAVQRRLRFRVTDSSTPAAVHDHDFWLHIEADAAIEEPDAAPRITGAGFDTVFFRAGLPSDLTAHAKVEDFDANTACVKLVDEFGNFWGNLLDDGNTSNGDLVAGDGLFSARFPGLVFPLPDQAYHFVMRAVDTTGRESLDWPFLVVGGGPPAGAPQFEDPADLGSQTAAETPFITMVEFPADAVPAGETSNDGALLPVTVRVDRQGRNVTKVIARVRHSDVPERVYETSISPTGAWQLADEHLVTLPFPAMEMGWAHYAVNVQVEVKDPQTQATYRSDWWPRIRVHQ